MHARAIAPRLVAILLAGAAIAGCADPYAEALDQPTTTDPVQHANRTGEWPAAKDTRPPVAAAPTAEAAVRRYAEQAINWTWRDLEQRQRKLARASVGQAREHAELMATTAAHDDEMRRGRITHSGTVQAIAARPGSRHQWIVVTRERSGSDAADQFAPLTSWHVYIAAAERTDDGWVVSQWRAQA